MAYGVIEAIRHAAAHLGLSWLVPVGAACVALDRVGSLCLWLGALARIPASVGISDYLPRSFARIHPRHGSPANAIWAQAVLVGVLVMLGQSGTSVRGAYNVLIEMMVVTSMLPFLFLFGAAIKLSSGAPVQGESRIWGGRPVLVSIALIGMLATAGSIVVASCAASGGSASGDGRTQNSRPDGDPACARCFVVWSRQFPGAPQIGNGALRCGRVTTRWSRGPCIVHIDGLSPTSNLVCVPSGRNLDPDWRKARGYDASEA